MSATVAAVRALVDMGDVIVSAHGEKELANDAIDLGDLAGTISDAVVVEDYPAYAKGPCVLVRHYDSAGLAGSRAVGHPHRNRAAGGAHHGIPPGPCPVVGGLLDEANMIAQKHVELLREGEYVAEVDVELLHEDDSTGPGWGPYYSLNDAKKLQSVRGALRSNNLGEAMKLARVYRLMPVSAA